MDKKVLKYCLSDFDTWERKQDELDHRFFIGLLTKFEYIYSCMELLTEHMPVQERKIQSVQYR